jgi:transcriptional regulator with XRE-family HTH domain
MRRALNQTELARQARVTKAMLSKYERGKQRPALDTLERILDAMGASLGDLELAMGEERERRGDRPAGPALAQSWAASRVVFSPPPGLPVAAQAKLAEVARNFGDFLYMLGETGARQAATPRDTDQD